VTGIVIVRAGREGVAPELVGKCLVEFADVESARKAATGLNRVKFDDRTVQTDFAAEEEMPRLKELFPEQQQPQ
jgi:RNA recognition motif-containing protein